MIGVCTEFGRNEATHVAHVIMRHLEQRGQPYKAFCGNNKQAIIDTRLDSKIVKVDLLKLVNRNLSHTIWTSVPGNFGFVPLDERSVHVLYAGLHNINLDTANNIYAFDYVLAPTARQALAVKDKFELANVAVLPFAPLPTTFRKGANANERLHVVIPMYGPSGRFINRETMGCLLSNILDNKYVSKVTVAYSKGQCSRLMSTVTRWARLLKTKIDIVPCNWTAMTELIAGADLMLHLPVRDNFAILPMTALSLGTPVMAWDISPCNEVVESGTNGVSVPCGTDKNWLTAETAVPNVFNFVELFNQVTKQHNIYLGLRNNVNKNIKNIREEFVRGLDMLLPEL